MATSDTATITQLHQPRPLTGAERTRLYRERQRAKAKASGSGNSDPALPAVVPSLPTTFSGVKLLTPDGITLDVTPAAPPSRHTQQFVGFAPLALRLSAAGLALVGLSMNAMYARSLGSSDLSGWLFLALGLCADGAALALPTVAAASSGYTRASAWAVWAVVFGFALLGSTGFAAVNVADVTMARGGRVTPAVVTSQRALDDAMAARDRECKGGVGRFCREREAAVDAARHGLELTMGAVSSSADPQTAAVQKLVTWASAGRLTPGADDVGNIRLLLLSLLPQIGGILLMLARRT